MLDASKTCRIALGWSLLHHLESHTYHPVVQGLSHNLCAGGSGCALANTILFALDDRQTVM